MPAPAPALPKPRRRWVAIVVAIVLWGVVGVVVNVAVAWTGEWPGAERQLTMATTLDLGARGWGHPVGPDWPPPETAWMGSRAMEDEIVLSACFHDALLGAPTGTLIEGIVSESRYGFPFRSLSSWWLTEHRYQGNSTVHRAHGVWWVPLPYYGGMPLPHTPLWLGFALNTIIYGALAWGVWQVPLAIRRWRRRGKGMCVLCGYDLKGLGVGGVCPECGSGGTPA